MLLSVVFSPLEPVVFRYWQPRIGELPQRPLLRLVALYSLPLAPYLVPVFLYPRYPGAIEPVYSVQSALFVVYVPLWFSLPFGVVGARHCRGRAQVK